MSRLRMLAPAATAVAMVGLVVLAPSPAQADATGSSGDEGFGLQVVNVVVRGGPGDPISGGSISISVPPTCWWAPFDTANLGYYDIDPAAPDAMTRYFEETVKDTTITFVPARLAHPSQGYLKSHEGSDFTWYTLQSAPGVNCADEGYTPSGGRGPEGWAPGSGNIPVSYAAFPGAEPAPPLVDVEDVVEEVWDEASADVLGPELGRNPEIDIADGATLVNIATWFWVQNVQEALAGDGEIHLDVSIPGTPVQATLDAATDGVQITSPVGATECTVGEAKTAWAAGASEDTACTMAFSRPNAAGWTVTGQTTWQGTWQGTDADGPVEGVLDALTPSAAINVPVAESQALVDDVD